MVDPPPVESTGGGGSIRERMAMLQLNQVGRNALTRPAPPPLPPKRVPPPLPARKTSRSSLASCYSSSSGSDRGSITSVGSNYSGRSLPPVYTGKESPPVQFAEKSKAHDMPKKNPSSLPTRSKTAPVLPPRGPPLPSRTYTSPAQNQEQPQRIPRRLPPPPSISVPPLPNRPKLPLGSHTEPVISRTPPPVPRSTRPPPVPLSTRPAPSYRLSSTMPCLVCYDFSGPDKHASLPQFERIRVESLQQLAVGLTTPFSDTLDKARVIFTWLHHNVSYDVHGFLHGKIASQDPEGVLQSGAAVCAGYAGLFNKLATHAGLESEVVSGHGKGYGFNSGEPYKMNHAWNAIKMDWGWHLIDCCWGSGSINGPPNPGYNKRLAPEHFINPPMSLAEVISLGIQQGVEPLRYSSFGEEFGFSEKAVQPPVNNIDTFAGRRTVFSLGLPCEHMSRKEEWVLFLSIGEFSDKNWILMNSDGRGRYHVEVEMPNQRGLKVGLYRAATWKGNDAKGLSAKEWQAEHIESGSLIRYNTSPKHRRVRIFIIERPHVWTGIEKRLAGRVMSISVGASEDDISKYLRLRLDEDKILDAMDERPEAEILKKIPETMSEIAILRESTISRRREKLSKMMDGLGLEDVYGTTIERMKVRGGGTPEWCSIVCVSRLGLGMTPMWISHEERPLQADELYHALAVELGSTDFDVGNISSIPTLLSCCQALVTVDKEALTVPLIHFTLQEYLSSHPDIFSRPHSAMAAGFIYDNYKIAPSRVSLRPLISPTSRP
ncbi:hypothetical protein B9Z19DRAFT_1135398 [Tuber borchii]|uniref:Transglutaminase-like domain-containing protein n=1 Tax=Tuber borchii TaxID=42251 RepID=A0A2T6ZCV8_TUBBO|nr:hypothetical protein B9Z19DRAFT_1135398 [Tuber borchii]